MNESKTKISIEEWIIKTARETHKKQHDKASVHGYGLPKPKLRQEVIDALIG